jgi:hypothetical protein
MGKASSAKKVARAARTGGGRTRRGTTSWVFPGLMAAVVILGTAGIVYSREQRQPDNTRPLAASAGRAGDHWHAAIGFYICGTFVPDLPEGDDPVGIHGHGDGVVHIHPFGASSSGKRARLGLYFDTVGADVTDTRIELPGQDTKRNGDKCGDDGTGVVRTKVWDTRSPSDQGRIVEGTPANIRPQDGMLITIAFGPENQDIPKPPSEQHLDALTDVGPQPGATTTTLLDPNAPTPTTVANDPNATTTSTTSASTTTAPSTTSTSRP